jgi:hypothetical protein
MSIKVEMIIRMALNIKNFILFYYKKTYISMLFSFHLIKEIIDFDSISIIIITKNN